MYNFYSQKNIRYSDVSGKILNILPVLILDEEIFIYDNNFFYENWLKNKKEKKKKILNICSQLKTLRPSK